MSRDETMALLEKAEESIDVARDLLLNEHDDFAASRSYYAMFYVAQALLLELGQSYSKHAAVIAAFGREFSKTEILDPEFHRRLIDAQDLRNIGDYGIDIHVPREKAKIVCVWAEEFLHAARDFIFSRRENR